MVQCALTMNVLKVSLYHPLNGQKLIAPQSYQRAVRVSKGEEVEQAAEEEVEEKEEPAEEQHGWKPRQPKKQTGGTLEPTMQGALLLQEIIGAGKGLNEMVLDRYAWPAHCLKFQLTP